MGPDDWIKNRDDFFYNSGITSQKEINGGESSSNGDGPIPKGSFNKKGKVLEAKTSTLSKLWFTIDKRDWTDPETGITYQINADGTIFGRKPMGGAGMLEFIGGGEVFKITEIGGFYIRAKTILSGGVLQKLYKV